MKFTRSIPFLVLLVVSIFQTLATAQQEITLEGIWKNNTFSIQSVPGFNFQKDGNHYTRSTEGEIRQFDLTTGQVTDVIFDPGMVEENNYFKGYFDAYSFSPGEDKILFQTGTEAIYRRSLKANYFVFDRESGKITPVFTKGKHRYASFSPQADKVAFVYQNDLWYKDLNQDQVIQITKDGLQNEIINGSADWVYEEEFSMSKAFAWSPDGQKIAFLRFDEKEVPEFTMTLHNNEAYPQYTSFKYPKVGEKNAVVSVHVYDLKSGKTTKVSQESNQDIYYPRLKWTRDPGKLVFFKMNRHQNELELILVDTETGKRKVMLRETNPYYIDIHDDLSFLPDGRHFIWTSEKDGYTHLYLYDLSGKQIRQITKGDYEVTSFYGYDPGRELLFFQAAAESPLEREVYSIDIRGKNLKKLTPKPGTNSAQFSSTYDYYVNTYSNANTPATYTVYALDGEALRTIEDNQALKKKMAAYGVSPVKFLMVKTESEVSLNAWMIKPPDFDESREYPLLMYVYGGPGSQTVKNDWLGSNYWWFQLLAQKGYIVASVDNRGTGGRGQKFKKMTYMQLGKYETIDQIESAKFLGSQSYIDEDRIGIFGWSYGGYMASLALFKGADVFKTGIAVAPVTNWKWYDTIYTERYMRTYRENQQGYEDNSPVNFADRLKGDYLLIHGAADDNVHLQNSVEMAEALIRANKQFDTHFYPNRNHSIYGANARLHLYTKMTDFLLENL